MINCLYGLLIDDQAVSGWFAKQCTSTYPTEVTKAVRDILVKNVPEDRIAMFACLVCYSVMSTRFGDDIRALDPENTYNKPTRPPGASASDLSLLAAGLIGTAKEYKLLYRYLDYDIKEQLVIPTWDETIGAACLQMLREVNK